jgi:hypothetical protein
MGGDPTFDRRRFARVDVSLGGVRFQCVGLDVKAGDLLRVTFTFGQRSVPAVGQCVRVDPLDDIAQDVAMSFLKMDDATRALLETELRKAQTVRTAETELCRDSDAQEASEAGRREFVRIAVDSIVSVSRASVLDVVAQASNVSAGGIHFIVEGLDVTLGDVLRVTIEVDGEPMHVVGQLVRVTEIDESKQEAALAFLDLSPEVAMRLRGQLEGRRS